MRHGTFYTYNRLHCRCIDCRDFVRHYRNQLREASSSEGVRMVLDTDKVRRIMRERRITEDDIAATAGVDTASVYHWLKQQRVGLYTLDRLAVALGTHYSLLTPEDCVSALPHEIVRL